MKGLIEMLRKKEKFCRHERRLARQIHFRTTLQMPWSWLLGDGIVQQIILKTKIMIIWYFNI